ncbi:unnamed protein product [Parnassius apollo]|uniref:(apollo) hypothetical protein n=1 Tax=Parnassius apollo TaxID=110799 RepID=A0A8S3WG80_PARAO|nr:unnamed protein product [Parnassius apollo]
MQWLADTNQLGEFYAEVRHLLGTSSMAKIPLSSTSGEALFKSREEINERWAEHFNNLLNVDRFVDLDHVRCLPQQPFALELDEPVSPDEVALAIKQQKNQHAVVVDFIPGELMKYGGGDLYSAIWELFVIMWEKEQVPNTFKLHDLKSIKTLEEISGKPELLPEPDNVVMQTMQKANELTPMTKTNIFINEELPQISESSKAKVKQKLLQHHVMKNSLKETYRGAADGVGGVVKRTLDARVAYGVDIVDAESVFDILSKTVTSVKTFYVPESNIEMIQIPEPERVTPIPSTMKVHQVIATEYENIIKYRPLSCFCMRGNCDCFDTKMHNLIKIKIEKKLKKRKNRCKNSRKNQDSSTENTDMEIEYAESDTSEWNENESFVISSSEENAQNIQTESESKIQENQKKKTRDKEIVKNNGKNKEELKKSIFKGPVEK